VAQDDRFAELLAHVAREVRMRQAAEVCCGELTLEQFQTLRAVGGDGPLSIGALSVRLRVELSTMSRNVSVLERNGHLTRARDAEDGRVVTVKLTAKGRRALDTLRCDERDVLRDVYDRLPARERSGTIRALAILRDCLETTTEASGAACCPPAPAARKGAVS